MSVQIQPAILEQDINEIQDKLNRLRGLVKEVHLDVMDNEFVPNQTVMNVDSLADLNWGDIEVSLHLMIANPILYVKKWAMDNVSSMIVHKEAVSNLGECLKLIHSVHKKAGVAINPHTATYDIKEYLDELDIVLIMGVEPGFSAQAFNADVLEKIRYLREIAPNIEIYVDGGVNGSTKDDIIKAGASVLCANSYIFNADDPAEAIETLATVTTH